MKCQYTDSNDHYRPHSVCNKSSYWSCVQYTFIHNTFIQNSSNLFKTKVMDDKTFIELGDFVQYEDLFSLAKNIQLAFASSDISCLD